MSIFDVRKVLIFGWVLFSAVMIISLGAHHSIVWKPAQGLAQASKEWKLTHILSSQCGCSKKVADYLISRKKHIGLEEKIVYLSKDHDATPDFQKFGFTIKKKISKALTNLDLMMADQFQL